MNFKLRYLLPLLLFFLPIKASAQQGSTSASRCGSSAFSGFGAHKFCGNNTASTGSAAPVSIGVNDIFPNAYAVAAGSVNVLAVTLSPPATALTNGLHVYFLPNIANTTTTPTLNVNGLGAITITKYGNAALAANDLTTTAIAFVIYDGTNFELQNPQTNTGGGGSSAFPETVTGGVSGAVSCFTSTTQFSAGTLLPAGGLVLGGGSGACPTASSNLVGNANGNIFQSTDAIGSGGASQTISTANGAYQTITLSAALTISFTQPTSGSTVIRLKITQASSGVGFPYGITWTSVKWPAGVVPVMSTGASAIDWYSCLLDGTNTWCTAGQNFQ